MSAQLHGFFLQHQFERWRTFARIPDSRERKFPESDLVGAGFLVKKTIQRARLPCRGAAIGQNFRYGGHAVAAPALDFHRTYKTSEGPDKGQVLFGCIQRITPELVAQTEGKSEYLLEWRGS